MLKCVSLLLLLDCNATTTDSVSPRGGVAWGRWNQLRCTIGRHALHVYVCACVCERERRGVLSVCACLKKKKKERRQGSVFPDTMFAVT